MTEQTYTVKEVATMMRCHPLTVIRWIKAGKLVGVKGGKVDGRGHWRIPKAEFDRLSGAVAHGVEERVS